MPGVGATCLDDIQLVPSGFSKITGGQCFPGTKRSGVQSTPFLFNHHGRQNKMNQVFQQPVEAFFWKIWFQSNLAPFSSSKSWQIKITDLMRICSYLSLQIWTVKAGSHLIWNGYICNIDSICIKPKHRRNSLKSLFSGGLLSSTPPQHPKTSWLALFKLFEVWLGQA